MEKLIYNYEYYTSNNQDIKASFGLDDKACLKHFVENGMNEGIQRNKIESLIKSSEIEYNGSFSSDNIHSDTLYLSVDPLIS